MTVHYQTESVRVRGKEATIRIVAVVCDACGGSHVHADAWNYDTEKALDDARYSSLWQIEGGQRQRAVCGRCGDAGVKLDDVIARSDGSAPPPDPDAAPENELAVRPAETPAELLRDEAALLAGRLLVERLLARQYTESHGKPWPDRIAIKVRLDQAHDAVQTLLAGPTPAIGRLVSPGDAAR